MEDNNEIDDLSRSALENYKMNPSPEAWDALNADLSVKQPLVHKTKTKRFMLLSTGLVLLLLSFITFYYLTSSNNSESTGHVDNRIQADDKNQPELNNTAGEANDKSLHVKSSHVENPSKGGNMKINSISPSVKKEVIKISWADHNSSKKAENKLALNEDKKIRKLKNKQSNSDEKIINHVIDENSTGGNTILTMNVPPVKPFPDESQILINDSVKPDLAEKSLVTSPASDNSIEQKVQPGETVQIVVAGNNSKENNVKNDSVFLNESKSRWSIAGYYSPDHSKNYLKNNGHDYKNATKYYENEKPGYSFTTGLSLRYDLNKRWSISAGAAYSTIAYSITRPRIYSGYNMNNELHYQYPTSCGIIQMPASAYPVVNEHDTINSEAACAQKVKFIKIPLTVRFTVTKKRFSYYSDFGFSPNFIIQ